MTAYDEQAERNHLIAEASKLFPNTTITIDYDDDDEAIHLDIDGTRYTFGTGSDDDVYVFRSGNDRIVIAELGD